MNSIYQVGYLQRLPLQTNYVDVVGHVGYLLRQLPGTELVIDATGVGRPVLNLFQYSGVSPCGVMITAGSAERATALFAMCPLIW